MSLTLYSQNIQLNNRKDTVICFSILQGKFLLQTYYENELNKNLNKLSSNQLAMCDSVKKSLNNIILAQNTIIENRESYIELKDNEVLDLNIQVDKANKKILTLKRLNKITLVTSFIVGGTIMYLIK